MSFRCALALACFATVTSPGLSHAVRTPEPRCTEGTWTIDGGPVTIGPFEIHTIALTAGVPSVTPFCRAQHWALQRTGELRVLFACRDADGGPRPRFPLRLRALLSDGCTHMEGAFAIRRMNALARFTATKTGGACTSNDDCTAEAFCRHPLGQCTAEGRCAVRPWSCFGVFKPSCGCDGRNHFACEAAQAGISIASIEPCTTACGGVTGAECPGGEFCELPTGTCGSADLEGRCVPIGDACPELYSPVCGCDGVTYANDCFRQTAGAQKAHDGACEDVCGGIAGIPCPPGQVCDLPSFGCGSADLQGQCRPIGYCTQQYDPVCGCDGKTYGNDCERRNAGVQLSHPGVCDCVPVCCTLGARPYDYNGDGCPDSCTADACAGAGCPSWCQTACDCYAKFGTSFCGECPLACPNCGEHWECKENFCAEACGVIPVDTIGCALDATR